MEIVKFNIREHHNILRFLSHACHIEKKIFMNVAFIINNLKPEDYKGKEMYRMTIPMEDLIHNTTSSYENIKRTCRKITKKSYELKCDMKLNNGKIEHGTLFEVLFPRCFISNNIFVIDMMTTLLPYFSRRLEKYRNYNIIEAKFLKHKHSVELYKYLKDLSNQGKKNITISILNFKFELGLENKYRVITWKTRLFLVTLRN